VRPAAEVGEGAVGVQRHRLERFPTPTRPGVAHEVVDQLDLVILLLGQETLARVGHQHVLALEGLGRLHVRAHALFDRREVLGGDRHLLGEVEVVVEAAFDGRTDRDLHAGVELHHGARQHMGGVVADQLQGPLAGTLGGEDRYVRPVGQWPRNVAQLGGLAGLGVANLDR
jgi:hypothetical protein